MRELLIDAILDLSEDEYETVNDVIELAKENELQLVQRVIAVACFYRDQLNEC
jgi:hypothetical protein